jgi:aryl carrier-like protein
LDATLRQLAHRSDAAHARPLPFAVREVGEAYRRLGRTQYEGPQPLDDSQALGWQRLVRSVRPKVGDDALLTLRAVQSDMFVTELGLWETTGKVSDELIELGGDFVRLARLNQWWTKGHLNMSHDERWALALLRWTSLAGLVQREPYRLDRELEVVELRFLFSHPTPDTAQLRMRQKIVERYSQLDQDYPLDYSKGVLFAEAGQYDFAAASFMRHLQAHPQGQYAIRARNHLIWSSEQVRNLENDGATQ